MGRDYPDWGGQYNNTQFFPIFDMGEAAARLGSLITYDRRGSVVWAYGFEDGLTPVSTDKSGAASAVSLVTSPVLHGPFAAKLLADSAANNYAAVLKHIAIPDTQRFGFAALVSIGSNADVMYQDVDIFDAADYVHYSIRLDFATLAIQVDDGGVWTTVATLSGIPAREFSFFHLKLVVDLASRSYTRLILADLELDLSAYLAEVSALASNPYVRCTLKLDNPDSGLQITGYVDRLIFTANEPDN